MEREAAEARSAASRKRLQLVAGVVAGLLVLGVIGVVAASALSGGDDGPKKPKSRDAASSASAKLPEQKQTDVVKAAKAAGCDLQNPTYEGAGHEDKTFTPADYKTNPPTSGTHNPNWYEDGIYAPGDTPRLGELVHTLEHGRIDVQYRPGTPKSTVDQLETFVGENDGYHTLLFENTTKMPYAVAATAWTHLLGCKQVNDQTWDALRTFRERYIDKGPEKIP